MKLKYMNLTVGFFLITTLLYLGCDPHQTASDSRSSLRGQPDEELIETGRNLDEIRPTLSIQQINQTGPNTEFSLLYHKRDGQVSPRTAELFVSYSEQMEYMTSKRGQAIIMANKDLIVQKPTDGVLRVIIMSTGNLNHLESGELARLSFRGHGNQGHQIFIQERRSYFAPAEANIGVTIEDTPTQTLVGEE